MTHSSRSAFEAEQNASRKAALRIAAESYLSQAERLAPPRVASIPPSSSSSAQTSTSASLPDMLQRQLAAAKRVMQQAREEHERLRTLDARKLYIQAAEMFLKLASADQEAHCKMQAAAAMDAVEAIDRFRQGIAPAPSPAPLPKQGTAQQPPPSARDDLLSLLPSAPTSVPAEDTPHTSSGASLSLEEKEVLAFTSKINNKLYLPFFEGDLTEDFRTSSRFVDPDGVLALSDKQRGVFAKWARPSDISQNPKMIVDITSKSIKQTVVPNCSFVSSLAISADFEKRCANIPGSYSFHLNDCSFKKKIVTNCIYPQKGGQPIINPHGKYMVKLFLNGVWRKVVIDDQLPLGRNGDLISAHSINTDEMWVSLIEKAYLKVMGGYDFPGSNSGVDLHALSGWIPERMPLKVHLQSFNIHSSSHTYARVQDITDADWDRVWRALHAGDLLGTAATGQLSAVDGEKTGLVPTHAYALLDIRKVLLVS